jgi:CheY-like chemotaxis protein
MADGKILIIDDDPDISEVAKVILEAEGYTVEEARDGDSALKHMSQSHPDMIILDVMMNDPQEGFKLSRELRKDPEFRNIPILMVTSVREKTGIDFKEAAGDDEWLPVDEFLDKPVKPEVLLEKVRTLLKQ